MRPSSRPARTWRTSVRTPERHRQVCAARQTADLIPSNLRACAAAKPARNWCKEAGETCHWTRRSFDCEWNFGARGNELGSRDENFAFSGGRLVADDILRVLDRRGCFDRGVERTVVQPARRTEVFNLKIRRRIHTMEQLV